MPNMIRPSPAAALPSRPPAAARGRGCDIAARGLRAAAGAAPAPPVRRAAVSPERFDPERAAVRGAFATYAACAAVLAISPLAVTPGLISEGLADFRPPRPFAPDRNPWRGAWKLLLAVPAGCVAPVLLPLSVPLGAAGVLVGAAGALASCAFTRPPAPGSRDEARYLWLRHQAFRIDHTGSYWLRIAEG